MQVGTIHTSIAYRGSITSGCKEKVSCTIECKDTTSLTSVRFLLFPFLLFVSISQDKKGEIYTPYHEISKLNLVSKIQPVH